MAQGGDVLTKTITDPTGSGHVIGIESGAVVRMANDVLSGADYGGVPSIGTDTAHDLDIEAFRKWDSTGDVRIVSAAITKRFDATYVTGTNNGGLSSSLSALANDTWYHIFAVIDSGGNHDVLADTSITCANGVTDHGVTAYRWLNMFLTDGSANILNFAWYDDGWSSFNAPIEIYNDTTPPTSPTLVNAGVVSGGRFQLELESIIDRNDGDYMIVINGDGKRGNEHITTTQSGSSLSLTQRHALTNASNQFEVLGSTASTWTTFRIQLRGVKRVS